LIAQVVERLNQLMIAFGKVRYVHGADAMNLAKISLYYTYRVDFQHVNLQNPSVC